MKAGSTRRRRTATAWWPTSRAAPSGSSSRQGRDHTKRYPGIVAALRDRRDGTLTLDGELAVTISSSSAALFATPPLFMVFDCLHARGKDLRERPLYVRRNVIEDVLDGQDVLLPVRRLSDDGLKAWQEVLERGYEGLVAKDPTASYVGGRTLKWLKVKQPAYREGERGWEPQKS